MIRLNLQRRSDSLCLTIITVASFTVKTNSWNPKPAYVGQIISGQVQGKFDPTSIDGRGGGSTFVIYNWSTAGVWYSPDGNAGVRIRKKVMTMPREPIHPDKFLADELAELQMSAIALARTLHVPPQRIHQLLNGTRAMTADIALRLSQWLGTSPELWMNLQNLYELRLAEQQRGDEIKRTVPRRPSAPEQMTHGGLSSGTRVS